MGLCPYENAVVCCETNKAIYFSIMALFAEFGRVPL
jgi:hypothetical protein